MLPLSVRSWGKGLAGNADYGDDAGESVEAAPWLSLPSSARAIKVAAGQENVAILTDQGQVLIFGVFGNGIIATSQRVDVPDPSQGDWAELGACVRDIALSHSGDPVAAAVLDDGSVRVWGTIDVVTGGVPICPDGILGDDELPVSVQPIRFDLPATKVAVGGNHVCVILADGSGNVARCFSSINTDGWLGIGSISGQGPDGVNVPTGGEQVLEIAAGERHSCFLLASRTLRCVGSSSDGQLLTGSTVSVLDPMAESSPLPSSLVGIAAGSSFTCAVQASGCIRCGGANSHGEWAVVFFSAHAAASHLMPFDASILCR